MKKTILFCFVNFYFINFLFAQVTKLTERKLSSPQLKATACSPGIATADLDIGNVRARILTNGDMWWDLANPKYEIPKGSGKHSMFTGSLWFGGVDAGSQVKVAAQTYRQTGSDF